MTRREEDSSMRDNEDKPTEPSRWVDTCPVWPVGQYDDMAWAKEAAAAAKAEGRTNFIYWEPDEGEPHDVGTD